LSSALIGEGSLLQFVDELFLSPGGGAEENLKIKDNLPQAGLSLINLVNFMNSSEGKDKMTVISIKNFQLCLGSILADVQSINQNYDGIAATFTQFDKDQSYIKLLDKARGCTAKCPCCLRACDADHSLVKLSP
ncbi:unnamed protein product, partial [Didymodactylos carnosus]